ncbi:hypothetical protein [Actinomadura oligospora]|uniref:hypothetical protein n=1 Tax=Actinomadura oligospora TaxID=111804 RepID=UPI0004790274|nr:hypothetical protein [Actinomadura oligospora]
MRVELTAAVLEMTEPADEISTLLGHFNKGRHSWVIAPQLAKAADSLIERNMAPPRVPAYQQLARKAATQQHAYRTSAAPRPVRISPDDLKEHVDDLDRPAVLVVENDGSDRCFVNAIARICGGADILDAIDKRWLQLGHGGGGDVYRRSQEEHDSFRRVKRAAALLDSDRWAPGTPEKNAHRIAELRALGLRIHVLTLREAENYVPNRVLHAVRPIRHSSARLDHLKKLDHDQRGHFDMKHGFKKTKGVPEQQRHLFADADPRTIAGLEDGFGSGLMTALESMAHRLTEADLARDVGEAVPGELRGLLAMLREIL